MKKLNYQRLLDLKCLIENGDASPREIEEYIRLLYLNKSITKTQYVDYLKTNNNEIVNTALTIGGIILSTWLISKLLK